MAENPTIVSLQAAAKDAAEAAAAVREKAPAAKPTPQEAPKPTKEVPPSPTPSPEGTLDNLAAHIKSKYGIDLKEDEILSRLQNGNGNGHTAPPVREKRVAPKPEDITEDQIKTFFEKNEKKDVLERHTANKAKADLDLVKEVHMASIKEQFPKVDDTEALKLFNERFFIPGEGEADVFEEYEKEFGQNLIKQEAERLRNQTGYQLEGVRDILYRQAAEDYNMSEYRETVDSFIKDAPKKLTFTLGKSGAIDLGDYPVDLEDDTVKSVMEIMREPQKLITDEFRDKDDKGQPQGELNLQKMYDFLMKGKLFDTVLKSAAVDYYSLGVDAVANKLHNNPDLSRIRPPEKKSTKREEQEKAEDYNQKQIGANIGRGRIK